MKTSLISLMLIIVIGLISCDNDSVGSKQSEIKGELVSNSSCKYDTMILSDSVSIPDTLSCVYYSYDKANMKLNIKHVNSAFNCCPELLSCDFSLQGDTIIIKEKEAAALCNCMCLYDLDMIISGIEFKKYILKFYEPYISENERISFEIDLNKESTGSFCVVRKFYPYGMAIVK